MNMNMNMKIVDNDFEIIPIEFKDEIKKKRFYDILGKINEEIRLLSQKELTQGVWGSSVGHINYHSLYLKEIFELVENQQFFLHAKKIYSSRYGDDEPRIGININVNLPGSKYQHIHRDFKAVNDGLVVNFGCQDISKKNGSINLFPSKRGIFYSTLFSFGFLRNQISLAQGNALIRWGSWLHGGSPNRTDIRRVMVAIVLIPSANNLTGFTWDYSLKKGPRSNFFNSSFRKRFTLFFASKTPFLFNQIYQVKRFISEFYLK
jgi:hypothetical protein